MENWIVGNFDLTDFSKRWLGMLDGDSASMTGLLEHVSEGYSYGAHFMMANIGPRASEENASDEALLLYGVLAAYQNDKFPNAPAQWIDTSHHLEAAFEYAHSLGERAVAENLLGFVADRTLHDHPTQFSELLSRTLGSDPARVAAHEQLMATLDTRDVRAAALFDPSVSIDDIMWSRVSDS